MRKVNQDSFCIQQNLAGHVSGLWIMGVMDGHGQNGHQVSHFCKKMIPEALTHFVGGAAPKDLSYVSPRLVNKRKRGGQNSSLDNTADGLLPKITAGNPDSVQNADTWLSTDYKKRDKQIQNAFEITEEKLDLESKIDAMFSGTTSVYCFLSNNHLVCANSGDSRAILCSLVNGGWQVTQLTRDHKPEEADEAARVRRCNGRIE